MNTFPRRGREAGGGPPLLNFERGVQNVKKVHIPAAPGKNAGPPNVKKLRPRGSGAAGAARPLLSAAAAAGKKGAAEKRIGRVFARFAIFGPRRPGNGEGGRPARWGAVMGGGAAEARGARGGEKKRGAARREKNTPREKTKNGARLKKRGAERPIPGVTSSPYGQAVT